MQQTTHKAIVLKDYAPPPQFVRHVSLRVKLSPTATTVESRLRLEPLVHGQPLVLDGEGLSLKMVTLNGAPATFELQSDRLIIQNLPETPFELHIVQTCDPIHNTALSGLYLTNGVYCTQMEAQGFRRFAYMQDRPDVMATYEVRVEAPLSHPVLLANGNPGASGPVPGSDFHFAEWIDPHPKPTYLFALVAGNLARVTDNFQTAEGRDVSLGIYVEHGKQDRCAWAMESLKAAMRWDEERFGRIYDLDVFNIVAVSDFNMGAMENKGLNIFNDKYVLATPQTATDLDYAHIERIVAHEYFHNWTGNRITCREWFQLCLKEGLTVFRDQEFTSDLRSRAVKRIEDVKTLRARQFPEDQGPLAHAVRPESYIEINNFYTPTVYEKGAEICRMLNTVLGRETFRKGLDLYFERHDGQAVRVEEFLACMAEVSGHDLKQFALWYSQAGTPIVDVQSSYDGTQGLFHISVSQNSPPTPGQNEKKPLHIPLCFALLDEDGSEIAPTGLGVPAPDGNILHLTKDKQSFVFGGLRRRPVLSINRGFSAPILLKHDASEADLLFRVAHDSDSFNKWEAAQSIARQLVVASYKGEQFSTAGFAQALKDLLLSQKSDDAFKALMLQIPTEAELAADIAANVDASRLHATRDGKLQSIASELVNQLVFHVERNIDRKGSEIEKTQGRALQLTCLTLLAYHDPEYALRTAEKLFASAGNMTVEAGAIAAVIKRDEPRVGALLDRFYARHADDHLLIDKWFAMQASRNLSSVHSHVEALTSHSAFNFKTPNRVFALFNSFIANMPAFHAVDGSGYRLLADAIIKLNAINPQVASRLATGFRSWRCFDSARQSHASHQMQRILDSGELSPDVFEIISRTLH